MNDEWTLQSASLRYLLSMYRPESSRARDRYDGMCIEERHQNQWYIAPDTFRGPQGNYGPFPSPEAALQALDLMLDLNERPRFTEAP